MSTGVRPARTTAPFAAWTNDIPAGNSAMSDVRLTKTSSPMATQTTRSAPRDPFALIHGGKPPADGRIVSGMLVGSGSYSPGQPAQEQPSAAP
jgi:hypothetical protein